MIDLSGIEASLVDDSIKGMPGGLQPISLSEIGGQGWNLLREDMPLPLAVIRAPALAHNGDWMRPSWSIPSPPRRCATSS